MSARLGWALAACLVALAGSLQGWRGALLAVTVVVFWLLLQFGQAMRTMRRAARSPVGHVTSAIMLNARLQRGMTMMQVLALTQSLGRQLSDTPPTWAWEDAGGDAVHVVMAGARLDRWTLRRAS
jgi:hypothetical protein